MIKSIFQKSIKKYLQKLGIYIQYYPTAHDFCKSLSGKKRKIKKYELKRITKDIAAFQDHIFYDSLLKNMVPSWNIEYQTALFFGKGMGESSLDSYRKIRINNIDYYEKVYFSKSPDLKTVIWFSENIARLLSHKIITANPSLIFKGDELTILYFPFLKLEELEESEKEQRLIGFSKDLYEISLNNEIKGDESWIPESFLDVKEYFLYRRNFKIAKRKLKALNLSIKKIEKAVFNSKRVLTHGDLNEGNGFKNNILIDWDAFGFYPIGLEAAYLYYRMHLRKSGILDHMQWVNHHYGKSVKKEDWEIFKANYNYFLFVFVQEYSILFPSLSTEKLLEQLSNNLKDKFN